MPFESFSIEAAMEKINELRQRFIKAADGKEALLQLILESEVTEQVYNSNAIENSTLNLEETDKILLKVDLDRYINEREIFEAKNLARVVTYIDKKAKTQEMSLELMKLLHQMLIANINDKIAGRFRKKNEFVRVGSYIAPAPEKVERLLKDMLIEYHGNPGEGIVKRLARLHLNFEHIHPFVDGNGRIGRAINNFLLLREGYVPINIKFTDRALYYDAFKEFDKKRKTTIMESIISKALKNSYFKRLAYVEGKEIITLSEFSKREKTSHSNLLNKANRQTIEAFVERDMWKIGAAKSKKTATKKTKK